MVIHDILTPTKEKYWSIYLQSRICLVNLSMLQKNFWIRWLKQQIPLLSRLSKKTTQTFQQI